MSWRSRLTNVFDTERLDRDLDDEQLFHVEARAEALVERGVPPEEAIRQARRRFGNLLKLRESSHETKLHPRLECVLQDARFGLRMLRKNPMVTAAAVLSLALTIGAFTAAFSLIDALFLRPFPVADPDSLVYLSSSGPDEGTFRGGPSNISFSLPMLDRLREASRAEIELFGIGYGGPYQNAVFDGGSGKEEVVRPQWISGAGFGILGIRPALGRLLTAGDDTLGGDHAAVLSHAYWMRRFGGKPAVIGQKLTLSVRGVDSGRFQIVGVAPKGFSGIEPGQPTDLWFPLPSRNPAQWEARPGAVFFHIRGRLKNGVAAEQARSALQVAFTKFRHEWTSRILRPGTPVQRVDEFVNARLELHPGSKVPANLRTKFERPLWILALIAGLVLLLACSNVANLLVARAAAREREMALRVSIGAGRGRLLQQMLIESGLLAFAGCVLGLAFAAATAPFIVRLLAPSDFPAYLDLHVDGRVLGFVALIGLLTTLLFGLAPALRASAVSPIRALQAGGDRHSARIGILRPLLMAQVSFCFAVLFIAGLLLLSFFKLTTLDLGFSKDRVVICTLSAANPRDEKTPESVVQLLERTRRLPGVRAASLSGRGLAVTSYLPPQVPIRIPGPEERSVQSGYMLVSPGFFETMQIRLLAGREFVPADAVPPATVSVIVNRAFASRYFADEDPLGKRFLRIDRCGWAPQQIVGVARDARYNTVRDATSPMVFSPSLRAAGATLEVRAAGDPSPLLSTLKDDIEHIDPSIRVTSVSLQSTRIDDSLLQERLLALLAGFFAVVAVVLAAMGLYGVLNYSVAQRTKEIGIRITLGARQLVVARLVVADMLVLTVIGVAIGIAGGLSLARYVATFLFEVKPSDFFSVALPLACLLAASGLAAIPATTRAVRVDPIVALRHE
jgi:putative ABC transport system permease protein